MTILPLLLLGRSLGLPCTAETGKATNPAPASSSTNALESIERGMAGLRDLTDVERAARIRELAHALRAQPPSVRQMEVAAMVAFLSTEGDLGRNTLQSVGDLLTQILAADPPLQSTNTTLHAAPALARLVRYEGVTSPCTNSQYLAELKRLASADETAAHADFNLQDLSSKEWNLRSLKGKIVLLNFWATWCPPCRRELPDLQFLADAYSDQLIVLGLTDEDAKEVRPFVARMGLKYPILTYSEPAVAKSFGVEGLPKTLIYDAQGKLAAQAVDMRTRAQFESLLQHAGLKKTTAKAP